MIMLVSEKKAIPQENPATRSGSEIVPRVVREAGPLAVESYLCFFAQFRVKGRSAAIVYKSAANLFFGWCERTRLSLGEIRPGHADGFLREMNDRYKRSTLVVYAGALRRLMHHLVSDRVLPSSPFDGVSLPGPSRPARMLKDLKEFLRDLDGYNEGSPLYRPGLVAMYPVVIGGQDTAEIARVTGLPLEEVETYARILSENGIWRDGKVSITSDFDGPDGEAIFVVEMVMIIGCAAGIFVRVAADGESEAWHAN